MQNRFVGIIIFTKECADDGLFVKCISETSGIISGFIPLSSRQKKRVATMAELSVGNMISILRYGRENSLGKFVHECVKPYTNLAMMDKLRLSFILASCEAVEALFSHNENCSTLKISFLAMVKFFSTVIDVSCNNRQLIFLFVLLIKTLLSEAGYGFQLKECVATGDKNIHISELIYLSPKSGGAVSRQAGEPYKHLLLNLPSFFIKKNILDEDISSQFQLDPLKPQLEDGLLIVDKFFTKFSIGIGYKKAYLHWERLILLCNKILQHGE